MRQAVLLALTITLTMLSGCAGSAKCEAKYTEWKSSFLSTESHEIKADVSASDSEKVCDYTLLYNYSADGETVEVLAPEQIAKVKAEIKSGEAHLCYDGTLLDTGSALTGKLSPLMSLPTFMEAIKDGHVENSWTETSGGKNMLVTELELPDDTVMTLWQDSGDMSPIYADMRSGDTVQLKITISEFK